MKNKKGISLIVLVITIIIMIILSAAIIISLSNNEIIGRANKVVNESNLKEVEHLASMLWADAYIDKLKDNSVDLEKRVMDGLSQEGINLNEYKIKVTDAGVKVESKEGAWETVYTSNEYIETGIVDLGANYVFDYAVPTRITLNCEKYNGVITSVPMYLAEGIYVVAAIHNNEVIYFGSDMLISENATEFSEEDILIMGMNSIDENGNKTGVLMLTDGNEEPLTDKINISKIEKQQAPVIFEGNITNNKEKIEGINITKDYVAIVEKDGVEYPLYPCCSGINVGVVSPLDANCIVIIEKDYVYKAEGIIIKKIYEIGESTLVRQSGEFVVFLDGKLIRMPSEGEHVLPKEIKGIKVKDVYVDLIRGKLTIEHPVKFNNADDAGNCLVVLKKEAGFILEDFITNADYSWGTYYIDITDFGDDVVIDSELMKHIYTDRSTDIKVIVTENAKRNLYASYENIITAQ